MLTQPTQMSLARISCRTLLILVGIAVPVTGHADESTLSASATCKQARKYVKNQYLTLFSSTQPFIGQRADTLHRGRKPQ
jgi:hypothetical protein